MDYTGLVEKVSEMWLFWNRHLEDPVKVHDQCALESERFLRVLLDGCYVAQDNAKLIYGFKFGEYFGQRVITQAHIAVQVGDQVYDWTARQFDPQAPVPKITSVEEFHAEWAPPGEPLTEARIRTDV